MMNQAITNYKILNSSYIKEMKRLNKKYIYEKKNRNILICSKCVEKRHNLSSIHYCKNNPIIIRWEKVNY